MYCFIVNKVSGNGRALKIWSLIEKILQEKNIRYCVHFTQKSNHATQIVQEYINNKETAVIIAVGGDGTVHEAINGLSGSNIPLGIIPAGSGNDFCRALGIPLRFDKALERILKDERKVIDIGRINDKYYATVVGIGFDGQVAHTTNISKYKKLLNLFRLGGISYIVGVFKVLFYYKPTNVDLKVDKKQQKIANVWLIAVANSPSYAGGMLICPNAINTDGLFDICIVQGISRWELLRILPTVFKGKHTSHPSVTILKAREVEILSDSPMIAHGDGEIIGQTPVKISVKPRSLYVL
ncbi:diacylglycerol kinase family lipid kinase [Peribacillus cavernae]|uniref:Diacylglycerol kinase family lipid kinase n=1 Tax=Peribacillus cavernae TaxID=1674310 RepID=A0A3S0TZY4_9BACI|nr:diacylglycerol kinase family protein [Peribacillus cavernae]MDQ0217850.1 YegS/Rv2252/BmrU family lipid kinase [Peribacillus cavernae]RUQ28288.1 diacylglycerol kinase family lipid kinase [Peribacillus cavernae]